MVLIYKVCSSIINAIDAPGTKDSSEVITTCASTITIQPYQVVEK